MHDCDNCGNCDLGDGCAEYCCLCGEHISNCECE